MEQQQTPATPARARIRGDITRPAGVGPSATYPPMTWSRPTTAQVLAGELGGIGKALTAALVSVGVLIGAALVIAIALAAVVHGFGIDVSTWY
ncbi:hypothetical protein [Actinoplanes sp. L3-i22]|uniref:hypothetical protein n=1 Tax=Actinoplanes sp. L3-i22 TaxID=2836373 RepID=UPI001C761D58|nr:hypothetical protein [Actinoplanes sp. L3-i22]BCY12953.1 hypothetical protein L3i22_080410 [Actinoplanes sp. L3-i22]